MTRSLRIALGTWLLSTAAFAATGYQTPPPELQAIVDAPRGPIFELGPKHRTALLIGLPGLPSISEVAAPELKLAGLRINPRTRAASRFDFGNSLTLLDVATDKQRAVAGLPEHLRVADALWSPDEKWVAFSQWSKDRVELWLVDVEKASAKRLIGSPLNAIVGTGFQWAGDSRHLLVQLQAEHQKPMAAGNTTPVGPNAQETTGGKVAQTKTYADLLKTPHDADLLEWELQSQLAMVSVDGKQELVGSSGPFLEAQLSPDGKRVLVETLKRPYSYLVPLSFFPRQVAVWDARGKLIKQIADRPLVDRLPPGNDAVPTGPRDFDWRNDKPATLFWVEAQDGGDPAGNAAVRDRLFEQASPFTQAPHALLDLAWRFEGVQWARDDLALVKEQWWKTRDTRTWRIHPGTAHDQAELLFARKSEDHYADPGEPAATRNTYGRRVLRTSVDGKSLFLVGQGASPEGDRPFLDRYDLGAKQATRLWRSEAPYFEQVAALLDDEGKRFISLRESVDERPNFYLHTLGDAAGATALTQFPHPTPQLRGVKKSLLHYKRADGVELTAALYLPPDYDAKRDGPRPLLMWAYPQEFKTASAASQVTDSPYRFNRISYWGPQALLARGYVVLDHPAMPIVGEGNAEPNDTYLQQLEADAKAAVDEVVRLGVTDSDHIAIGGHSYGAFMTANLLAHTRLFRAGIARSGAYNRTLTPFGFQAEDRNFWDAKLVYGTMSPFNYAEQIKDALLLIHGEMDDNMGTFPMQSERLYQAVQGLGGTARLVFLPNEAHHYRARESIMQMLWEEDRWLDQYVKHAAPRDRVPDTKKVANE